MQRRTQRSRRVKGGIILLFSVGILFCALFFVLLVDMYIVFSAKYEGGSLKGLGDSSGAKIY